MSRGLDHIVHAVHDLDAAADFYRRAGFKVGARNMHPWGTHNHVVQFPGFFIEILTVAEPEKIVPHAARSFSFGAFHRDFLDRRQGLAMILLSSADARADARAFNESGIGDFDVFDFAREGARPDGSSVKLAFSLAFARDPSSPDAGFAACQHHFPENFWNPEFQQHANGAGGVLGVAMVADNPADHHIFLEAFTGVRDLQASSAGVTAHTPRGDIEIIDAVAFRDQFGITVKADGEGASFGGLRLSVPDLDVVGRTLNDGGIAFRRRMERMVIPPEAAFGATLIFEERR
jgi:hypothetical protein